MHSRYIIGTSPYTLGKKERLKSRKLIDQVFNSNTSLFKHPIKLVYAPFEESTDDWYLKCGFTVPKRYFKSAVKRNLIKRRIREAYRLHKAPLQKSLISADKKYALMMIYISPDICDYQRIEQSVIFLLERLMNETSILNK